MTITDLITLQSEAIRMLPCSGPQYPPSVYYRYLALIALKKPAKLFVELGTCGGGCSRTVAIKSPNTQVISIDVHKHDTVTQMEPQLPNFRFIKGDSIDLAKIVGPQCPIDLLFIDTIHTYEHTMNEFNAWRPYMAPGGIICFDDLHRPGMDKVWNDLSGTKTGFNDLARMHIGGSPTDGGFGALIV